MYASGLCCYIPLCIKISHYIWSLTWADMYDKLKQYFQSKANISDDDFDDIKKHFTERKVQKGEILQKAGETAKNGAFVIKGCLRGYVIDHKGKEHIIQFTPENWWIADQSSLSRKEPAMFYIDALEDSEVMIVHESFVEILEKTNSEFAVMNRILWFNSFRALQKRLINHLSATANERYLDFIKTYPDLALRLPQHMIASYIGVAPESLSRIRKEMMVKG